MHERPRGRVLLVGWSGADAKIIQPLLDRGEMPALEKIARNGVLGEIAALSPLIGPALWTSIATGKRPSEHGVHGYLQGETGSDFPRAISPACCRCRPIWEILSERELRSQVIGWPGTHPAPDFRGICVSEVFAVGGSGLSATAREHAIAPARLRGVLSELRVGIHEIDAAVMELFVPRWAEIDRTRDSRLTTLAANLAEMASIQAAATWLMANEPWDLAAICFPSPERICRDFIEFHPPWRPGVPRRLQELYGEVVSSTYRFLDLMLSRLLQLTNEGDLVVIASEHGYFTGAECPRAQLGISTSRAFWRRPRGLLALSGPGVRRDERIDGHILQIAPTILSWFGLPIGDDMEGGVLQDAFAEPMPIARVTTWEKPNPAEIQHAATPDAADDRVLASQLAAWAELDLPADPKRAMRRVIRENTWNRAVARLDAEQFAEALPLLEAVYASRPERTDYAEALARCQMRLGHLDEAEETLEAITDVAGDCALSRTLLANLAYERGNFEASLAHLRVAERADPQCMGLQNQIGLTLCKLGQWVDAESSFRNAIECNADDPYAHLGLAHALLHRGQYTQSAESALEAISRRFHIPLAHATLGMALCGLGESQKAIVALENAVRLAPGVASPHRMLAQLYQRMPGQREKAAAHWEAARAISARPATPRVGGALDWIENVSSHQP